MTEENTDTLKQRRDYFQQYFPMIPIAKERTDIDCHAVTKNTCPACGYMTLEQRNAFDICIFCFWEDDGMEDFESDKQSSLNQVTLDEAREAFMEAKQKLRIRNFNADDFRWNIQVYFAKLDKMIGSTRAVDFRDIKITMHAIRKLLLENKVFGIASMLESSIS